MKRPPKSTVLWAVTALGATLGVGMVYHRDQATAESLQAQRNAAERSLHIPIVPNPITSAPLPNATLIRDRAVFYISRVWIPPPAPPLPTPAYHVASVLVLPDGKSVAIVRKTGGTDSTKLHLHDSLDGWSVAEIALNHVVLSNQTQRTELLPTSRTSRVASARPPGVLSVLPPPPTAGTPPGANPPMPGMGARIPESGPTASSLPPGLYPTATVVGTHVSQPH